MGKYVTVDSKAEATKLFEKTVAAVRKATTYLSHADLAKVMYNWCITVECDIPQHAGEICEALIKKHDRAVHVKTTYHEGKFDWASDTYLKPGVVVFFKI